jgi:hypothetical protein
MLIVMLLLEYWNVTCCCFTIAETLKPLIGIVVETPGLKKKVITKWNEDSPSYLTEEIFQEQKLELILLLFLLFLIFKLQKRFFVINGTY